MASSSKLFLVVCAGIFLSACDQPPTSETTALTEEPAPPVPAEVTANLQLASSSTLGDPLPDLSPSELARFTAGLQEFSEEEEADEGLGPVFNEAACIVCHDAPVGGTTGRLETRFGRRENGEFDPLASLGGSLLQDQGIGPVAGGFVYHPERVPRSANVVALRMTTPLFGLGLVDAVPDAELIGLARAQQATRTPGRVHMVKDVHTGEMRVGRFGFKNQVATLQNFSGDAYLNEMGFTSPDFPDENCPQGDCTTLTDNPSPGINDEGEGIAAFADFMTMLAPPTRGPGNSTGEALFQSIGCANCHTPRLATGRSPIAALNRKVFEPFSDFLLHDMGSLGDGIVQGDASGREFRTTPLWGLRTRPAFLHDGRAKTVSAAILGHDGQGRNARDRFAGLSSGETQALLEFLRSL